MNTRATLLSSFAVLATLGCAAEVNPSGSIDPNTISTDTDSPVFQDSLSPTARFLVYRYKDGTIAFSVQGSIGSDRPDDFRPRLEARSVVATYLHLRPDISDVPEILTQIDQELRAVPLPLAPPPATTEVTKSFSSFYKTECQTFYQGCQISYVPVACLYSGADTVGGPVNHEFVQGFYSNDRTYFWNDSDRSGYAGVGTTEFDLFYYVPIRVHTWGYTYWINSAISNWWAKTEVNGGDAAGNIGVTIHRYTITPC
jgi:hypothetical protein